jgi:4-hydroxy-tetrahydrodipicolinate reductase
MDIIINGANGRMGRIVTQAIRDGLTNFTVAARVSPSFYTDSVENTYPTLEQYDGPAHAVVDFSSHACTRALLDYCLARKLPLVIATTGQTPEELSMIRQAAEEIPIFLSANMSIGVALLAELAAKAAAVFPDADIEIIERHHNRKKDVPSGTALLLARRIRDVRENAEFIIGRHENGVRTPREIGIHSLRYGNEVGTHEIILSNGRETVTLKHEAEDRALFAQGALAAAAFLRGRTPGLYDMRHIIGKENGT